MMNKDAARSKRGDSFTVVLTVQTIICAALIAALVISASSLGELFARTARLYSSLTQDGIDLSDVSQAFRSVGEAVGVFSEKRAVSEGDTAQTREQTQSETRGQGVSAGGQDIVFTSLEALEGLCTDEYRPSFETATPLEEYTVTSRFGYRIGPITGTPGIHTGLDMAADYGESIFAFADGVVEDAAYDDSYGYYIKLRHEDDVVSIYAHCSELCAESGDSVSLGDKIAEVGSTGDSTGNHLHFELRKGNIRFNPEFALFDA